MSVHCSSGKLRASHMITCPEWGQHTGSSCSRFIASRKELRLFGWPSVAITTIARCPASRSRAAIGATVRITLSTASVSGVEPLATPSVPKCFSTLARPASDAAPSTERHGPFSS